MKDNEINYNEYMKKIKSRVIITDYAHINDYVDPAVITPPTRNIDILSDLEDIPGEIWTPIPGFSPCSISNYGRIRQKLAKDLYRIIGQNPVLIGEDYYNQVFLSDGFKLTRCRVDRVMYAAFIDPEFPIYEWNPEYEIIHKDGNTLNNDRENLLKIKVNN